MSTMSLRRMPLYTHGYLKGKEDYIVNLNKAESLKVVVAVTDDSLISLFIQVECFKSDEFRAFLSDASTR